MNINNKECLEPPSTDELTEHLRNLNCGATSRLNAASILEECHKIFSGNMMAKDLDLGETYAPSQEVQTILLYV
jgi:hypothetical protein